MITKSAFDQAQDILSGRYKSRSKYRKFAYTGLIWCGECGSGITAEKKSKTQKNGNYHEWTYYRCTKTIKPSCSQKPIKQEILDNHFSDILSRVTIPAEFHEWAIKQLKAEQSKEVQDQNKIVDSQQSALNSCQKNLSWFKNKGDLRN
jgi:site-specific DNA recombinase